MKNKLNLVLILIFGVISFSLGQKTSFQKPIGFVNDFENLLSFEEVAKLESLLINYEKQTSNEIVVITTNEIIKEVDFDDYALALAKNWAIGKKYIDNGLVLVISNKLRKIRICTGTGTEKILTDEICETILQENILYNFKNGEIYNGITSGINALINKWK